MIQNAAVKWNIEHRAAAQEDEPMTTQEEVAAIRKLLKALPGCEKLHVRNGTAWGYVDITGSADTNGHFTAKERRTLREIGLGCIANATHIEPDSRRYWIDRLQEIAVDQDYMASLREFVRQIEGGEVIFCRECWSWQEPEGKLDARGIITICARCYSEHIDE